MWRLIRTVALLLLLLFVGLNAYLTRVRSTSWERPLQVSVYPINGDGSDAAERFIAARRLGSFSAVEKFFAAQATQYGVKLPKPFELKWAATLGEHPPMPTLGASRVSVIFWSLRMRLWAARVPAPPGWTDIKLFVLYYDPASTPSLSHSFGMSKGLYAVVKAFADDRMEGSNQVILAHELLHIVGAADEYDPNTNQPQHPWGFAEPDRKPLYPQRYAELMGGRIPISPTESVVPRSLDEVIIGPVTAEQIRWAHHGNLHAPLAAE
jgi:hypothetical protein